MGGNFLELIAALPNYDPTRVDLSKALYSRSINSVVMKADLVSFACSGCGGWYQIDFRCISKDIETTLYRSDRKPLTLRQLLEQEFQQIID